MVQTIRYQKGYKYRLFEQQITKVAIYPETAIVTDFITLSESGILALKKHYASDGASGPTVDTPIIIRGAFIHDGGYQLLRLGLLGQEWKDAWDRELQKAIIEDGQVVADRMVVKSVWLKSVAAAYMAGVKTRAWYYYKAVKHFGGKSCQPGYEPYPVLTAP